MVNNESGQAFVEYILLLSIVAMIVLGVTRGLKDKRIAETIMKPIKQDFAAAYRYGHVKAKGYDDGGPAYHPRAQEGENSFRIFINPAKR